MFTRHSANSTLRSCHHLSIMALACADRAIDVAPAPHAPSDGDEDDNASTVELGARRPVVVDDGLYWDINTHPADPEGWGSMGLLGPQFNSKLECKWKKLSPTQTERMQSGKNYVFIQGPTGGFYKHEHVDHKTFEGNMTVHLMQHKGSGHVVLVRSMPRGTIVGQVFLSLDRNNTLYMKVHNAIQPESILFIHKIYKCMSMTRKQLTFLVWKSIGSTL